MILIPKWFDRQISDLNTIWSCSLFISDLISILECCLCCSMWIQKKKKKFRKKNGIHKLSESCSFVRLVVVGGFCCCCVRPILLIFILSFVSFFYFFLFMMFWLLRLVLDRFACARLRYEHRWYLLRALRLIWLVIRI